MNESLRFNRLIWFRPPAQILTDQRVQACGVLLLPATIVYAVAEYGVFIPIPAYPNSIYVYGTLALIGVGIVLAITIRHKPIHVDQSVFEQETETKWP